MSHHNACNSRCETSAREHDENKRRVSYHYGWAVSSSSRNFHSLLSLVVLLVTWSSFLNAAVAHKTRDQQRSADIFDPYWKGPSLLKIDTRPPPPIPLLMPSGLQRRQDDPGEEKATTTKAAAPSKSSIDTDPEATESAFETPKPFDTALNGNFSAECANFLANLLRNEAFTLCHPFSLLLQTSSGMFDASKSHFHITRTLDTTCGVEFETCSSNMGHFARELIAESNCGVDYTSDNAQIIQAYNGLIAYDPLYQASCLMNDDGNYCYANAVTNRDSTTDPYPYYLPLGVPLPGGTRATCNSCLQDVMAIFATFAANSTQPISKTYNGAAQQVGIVCGTTFVNQTAMPVEGAASTTSVSLTPTMALLLMFLLYLVQ